MAIRITALEQIAKELSNQQTYTYKDLFLDFEKSGEFSTQTNKKIDGNDIKVSYDEIAIRNSLRNLFNTRPGQRFLFPRYGLDLNQFLFEQVTEENGQVIGELIVKSIEKYEPRIVVSNVNVVTDPDNNAYEISIVVRIPILNTSTTINTNIDVKNQSFIFLDTERNR